MTIDVAIIGGGVSGLATAYTLKRSGHRVAVLERQASPGGNAVSERIGGYLMEHGPTSVANGVPAAMQYSELLGLDDRRCELGSGVRRRYLVENGGLHGISTHPFGFLTSGYLSMTARLRLMAEIAVPRGGASQGDDETIMDFATRRFGGEFAHRVLDPLVGGVYAGSAEELSVSSLFSKLVEMERTHGSVTGGLLRRRDKAKRMPGSRLFSWREGVATLPRALAAELGGDVHTGVTVRNLGRTGSGFEIDTGDGGTVRASSVVIATQPHVAAQLLSGIDADGAAAAADIAAPPLAVAFLGYGRGQIDHPLDGLGYLAAKNEGRLANGAQFCSTMFPGRAPDGSVSIAVYFGGARNPDMGACPENELIACARDELRDLIGATGEPEIARVRHWARGLPQYTIGHRDRLAGLSGAQERHPGLFLTGNYFKGPAIAACLGLAKETAGMVGGYLAGRQAEPAASVAVGTGSSSPGA